MRTFESPGVALFWIFLQQPMSKKFCGHAHIHFFPHTSHSLPNRARGRRKKRESRAPVPQESSVSPTRSGETACEYFYSPPNLPRHQYVCPCSSSTRSSSMSRTGHRVYLRLLILTMRDSVQTIYEGFFVATAVNIATTGFCCATAVA